MSEPSLTKYAYAREILGSLGKHRVESVLALTLVVTLGAVFLSIGGGLTLAGALLPLLITMILLQFVVASWRVYRTQRIVLTTKRCLADLDAFDRAQAEQNLRTYDRDRQERREQGYEANLKRLDANIAALTARLRGVQS